MCPLYLLLITPDTMDHSRRRDCHQYWCDHCSIICLDLLHKMALLKDQGCNFSLSKDRILLGQRTYIYTWELLHISPTFLRNETSKPDSYRVCTRIILNCDFNMPRMYEITLSFHIIAPSGKQWQMYVKRCYIFHFIKELSKPSGSTSARI